VKQISRGHFVRLGGATASVALGKTSDTATAPSEVDVIIVGARSFCCSTAWHQHERGRKVVVLEARDRPATQASHTGASFVVRWSSVHIPGWGKTEWEMQVYGIDFYKRLVHDCGFASCGICYIYLTPRGWDNVQAPAARAHSYGARLEVITAEPASKFLPLINFKSTAGILFDPDSIRVRAGDAIRRVAKRLERDGVTFKYNGQPQTGSRQKPRYRTAFRLTRFNSGTAERSGPWMNRKRLIGVEA
jgi:glycine/D-amino acid oxidase-like deaminating enzyme